MNKQLALLDVTDPAFEAQSRKDDPRTTAVTADHSPGSGEWWKLSREEKQQGLAGVRAIRAILGQNSSEQRVSMQKAS